MCMGKFLTTKEFINRAKEKHIDKYDYSFIEYVNSKTKVKISCKEHGIFEQKPYSHIQGQGCALCAGVKRKTTEKFIEEAKKIHKNKFNYNFVTYKNNRTKVKILCPKHGIFEQIPDDHLQGFGCAKCGCVKKLTNDEFINRSKEIHKQYDYSLVEYTNMHTKIKIICLKHGIFEQTPHNHLKFSGCPKCNKSKGEKIISWFLDKKNIYYEEQKKFKECKNKKQLPFDFYLPYYNTCIEFQGIQHYNENKHMSGSIGLKKRQINDNIKKNFCKKNNIKFIEIKYSDKLILKLKEELNIK